MPTRTAWCRRADRRPRPPAERDAGGKGWCRCRSSSTSAVRWHGHDPRAALYERALRPRRHHRPRRRPLRAGTHRRLRGEAGRAAAVRVPPLVWKPHVRGACERRMSTAHVTGALAFHMRHSHALLTCASHMRLSQCLSRALSVIGCWIDLRRRRRHAGGHRGRTCMPAVWDRRGARRGRPASGSCSARAGPAFGKARAYAERLDPDGWHVFQNGASVVHARRRASRASNGLPAGRGGSGSSRAARETGARARALHRRRVRRRARHRPRASPRGACSACPYPPRPFTSLAAAVVRAQWLVAREDADAVVRRAARGAHLRRRRCRRSCPTRRS